MEAHLGNYGMAFECHLRGVGGHFGEFWRLWDSAAKSAAAAAGALFSRIQQAQPHPLRVLRLQVIDSKPSVALLDIVFLRSIALFLDPCWALWTALGCLRGTIGDSEGVSGLAAEAHWRLGGSVRRL